MGVESQLSVGNFKRNVEKTSRYNARQLEIANWQFEFAYDVVIKSKSTAKYNTSFRMDS